ncbi:MAG: peroxiredoxin family protein [Myxococcota bacterium]
MLLRQKNWPVFIAIAILGPLLGYVAAQFIGGCSSDASPEQTVAYIEKEDAPDPVEESHQLVLPNEQRITVDQIAPGRATAIVVMKAPWCNVCKRQLAALSQRLDEAQNVNAEIVGLSTADAETNKRLADKLGLNFPILGDPSRELLKDVELYREGACHATPGVIFVDDNGKIASVRKGRYPGKSQDEMILQTLGRLNR